jgi:DNA-binding winged helix-turn-helix (wHTH) protein
MAGHRAGFADFDLDLSTGELRHQGTIVPLQRQPMRALVLLVSRAGQLVGRDELRQVIWDEATHVDFEGGLNFCIRQLRAALGEEARAPRFIETVPRQGYRFIAPVASVDPCRPPVSSSRFERRRRPRWTATAAALGGALVTAFTLTVLEQPAPAQHEASRSNHHQRAVALLRAGHDLVFGPGATSDHHRMAVTIARAVHDLVF